MSSVLLQQALLNLVSNAIDAICQHTPTGEGTIVLLARQAGEWGEFSVADNGGGIGERDGAGVLETFHTTKPEGLWIGLPIVQSILEQHEGRVEFENEVGRGLTVRLFVPLWRAGALS